MRAIAVILLLVSSSFAAEEIFIRVDPPERASWVGQQVLIPVTVGLAQRPSGSPQFRVPEVPGGVLASIPGPVYGSEERDGLEFTTWTYNFAFYPHRQGEHAVSSISVEARVPRGDSAWHQVAARTEPFILRSRLPAAAKGLATLVTTTELTVEEAWDPDRTAVRVGDAITRTVTVRAVDIMGMGLPPLNFDAPAGMAVHLKAPQLKDETHRGEIKGQRTETIVYVCEQEGGFNLPALSIPWFDPKSGELDRIDLPGRLLTVAPNPAFAVEQDVVETAGGAGWQLVFGLLCGILGLATLAFAVLRYIPSLVFPLGRRLRAFAQHVREPLPPLNPAVKTKK